MLRQTVDAVSCQLHQHKCLKIKTAFHTKSAACCQRIWFCPGLAPSLPPSLAPFLAASLYRLCSEAGKHAGRVFSRSLWTHFTFLLLGTLEDGVVFTSAEQWPPFSFLMCCEAIHQISHKIPPLEANSVNCSVQACCGWQASEPIPCLYTTAKLTTYIERCGEWSSVVISNVNIPYTKHPQCYLNFLNYRF